MSYFEKICRNLPILINWVGYQFLLFLASLRNLIFFAFSATWISDTLLTNNPPSLPPSLAGECINHLPLSHECINPMRCASDQMNLISNNHFLFKTLFKRRGHIQMVNWFLHSSSHQKGSSNQFSQHRHSHHIQYPLDFSYPVHVGIWSLLLTRGLRSLYSQVFRITTFICKLFQVNAIWNFLWEVKMHIW